LLTLFVALALIVGLAGAVTAKDRHSHAKHHAAHARDNAAHARDNAALAKEVPSNLMPPAGAVLLFELRASGDQIYTCDPTTGVWKFKAPQATLFNDDGEVVGSHYAGPTWQYQDGSIVKAKVVASADAPAKNAIPWLLLEATAHEGNGVFSAVTHIQRLATKGGVGPTGGCDVTGPDVYVPYKATYVFYNPAAS
jgi:hypothetical protein